MLNINIKINHKKLFLSHLPHAVVPNNSYNPLLHLLHNKDDTDLPSAHNSSLLILKTSFCLTI